MDDYQKHLTITDKRQIEFIGSWQQFPHLHSGKQI